MRLSNISITLRHGSLHRRHVTRGKQKQCGQTYNSAHRPIRRPLEDSISTDNSKYALIPVSVEANQPNSQVKPKTQPVKRKPLTWTFYKTAAASRSHSQPSNQPASQLASHQAKQPSEAKTEMETWWILNTTNDRNGLRLSHTETTQPECSKSSSYYRLP